MTRLDRAFIKAYTKTTAAPPSPHLNMPADAAPSQPQSDEASLARSSAAAALFDRTGYETARLDEQHAATPPHWMSPATSSFTTWDAADELPSAGTGVDSLTNRLTPTPSAPERTAAIPVIEPMPYVSQAPQVRIDPPAVAPAAITETVKKPPADPPAVASEPVAKAPVWRAAFEVDNLLWPEVNYSLAAACRGQWEQLMKEWLQSSRDGQKVVLVSSYRRGEGRTSLVLCLAQLLSQKQKRVAVVDADFQRPQIARQLKLLPACGWDEVVRDSQPLTEAWIESVSDGVTLLPLGQRADADGLTGNPRLKQTFEALRSQHDIVLIDAGAISDSNDRETLALLAGTAQIDSAVLVRDVRSTSWDTLHDSQKSLDAIGIGRWDVVENFAD